MTEENKQKLVDFFSYLFNIIGFSGILLFLSGLVFVGSYSASVEGKLISSNEKIVVIEKRIDKLDERYLILNDKLLPFMSEVNQRLKSIEDSIETKFDAYDK